jgi:hypothetical protein
MRIGEEALSKARPAATAWAPATRRDDHARGRAPSTTHPPATRRATRPIVSPIIGVCRTTDSCRCQGGRQE